MLTEQTGDGSDSEEWGGGRNKTRKQLKKGGATKDKKGNQGNTVNGAAKDKKGNQGNTVNEAAKDKKGNQGNTVKQSKKTMRWEKRWENKIKIEEHAQLKVIEATV